MNDPPAHVLRGEQLATVGTGEAKEMPMVLQGQQRLAAADGLPTSCTLCVLVGGESVGGKSVGGKSVGGKSVGGENVGGESVGARVTSHTSTREGRKEMGWGGEYGGEEQ